MAKVLDFFRKSIKDTADARHYGVLEKVSLFKNLSKSELNLLKDFFLQRKYQKNEVIFQEGFPSVVLYVVCSGKVQVYKEVEGEILILHEMGANAYFGEMGLFIQMRRTASIRALEDAVLLAISKEDFYDFIERFPRAGVKVLSNMGQSLCEVIEKMNRKLAEYATND